MCDYPFFIPQVVLFANSSLFWFKVTNEHREFRNYLYIIVDLHKIFNTDHLAATLFYICNLLLSQVIVHQNLFLNVLVINVNRQKFRLKVYMLFAGL